MLTDLHAVSEIEAARPSQKEVDSRGPDEGAESAS